MLDRRGEAGSVLSFTSCCRYRDHVPREVARKVWERDRFRCAFVDAEGRRCSERKFLTLEHRHPHALGGPPTVDNISVFCSAHNAHTARQVFGEAFIAEKRPVRPSRDKPTAPAVERLPDVFAKVLSALCKLGFRKRDAESAMVTLRREEAAPELEPLLRAALDILTPARA